MAVEPPARSPNVILVVIDTLRADRLGAYGNRRGLTPFLDRLAGRAFVFRRAYAPAAWTKPSVASLMTSRFESQHKVDSFDAVLGEGEVTLPEVLRDAGWLTVGFSANSLLGEPFGYAQGYDVYRSFYAPPRKGPGFKQLPMRARSLTEMARRRLGARTDTERMKPLFLYVQFMEPHSPYLPPADLLRRRLGPRGRADLARINSMVQIGRPLGGDDLAATTSVYDAMVASLDRELRGFFDALGRLRLLDDAVVVITADHGQEFMDHGRVGHGQSLYQELVHVPLLLLVPGHDTRIDVDDVVSLVDVAPTVLDLARVPVPACFEGRSLRPLLLEQPGWRNGFQAGARLRRWWRKEPGGAAFVEDERTLREGMQEHRRGVIVGDDKLLVDRDGRDAFYDLAADPAERENDVLPERRRDALVETLDTFRARAQQGQAEGEKGQIDERRREDLRALGYVE